jgi:ComF family protein
VKELSAPLSRVADNFLEAINFISIEDDESVFHDLVLVPVPLHKRRALWRGFNQAELICKNIGEHFGLATENLLERKRNTLPQAEIHNQSDRHKNIEDAFVISKQYKDRTKEFKNKTFILVDDVCTTTATLEECARALKTLKPKEVLGLVIARG